MIAEQIKAAARQWVVRLSDDRSPDVRAQFDLWRAEHPAHDAAYRNAMRVWSVAGELKHLAPLAFPSVPERRQLFNRPFAIAAGLLLAIGAAVVFFKNSDRHHETATAEIRNVALPDGSVATLGGRSAVVAEFTGSERRIVLKSGEAVFSVARDASRPFIVVADDLMVRAVGTEFEVHRGAGRIRISVLEGVVDITRPGETVRLTAGRQLSVPVHRRLKEASIDTVFQPVAWRSGVLRYEDTSLAEVISDANRYYDGEILLGDPALGELRLTTSFGTRQVEQLLNSLPGVLPVRLDRSSPGRVLIYPGPAGEGSE